MPVYDYVCEHCGITELDKYCKGAEINSPVFCDKCKQPMARQFPAPRGNPCKMFRLTYSHALGKYIKNKQDFVDKLKKINANVDFMLENPY